MKRRSTGVSSATAARMVVLLRVMIAPLVRGNHDRSAREAGVDRFECRLDAVEAAGLDQLDRLGVAEERGGAGEPGPRGVHAGSPLVSPLTRRSSGDGLRRTAPRPPRPAGSRRWPATGA